MDRRTLAWALVVFFGASLAFGVVRDLTADEGVGVALLVEIIVLVAIIAGLTLIVGRARR